MSRNRSQWTEPLIENGWRLDEACVCGGVYTEKFVNPEFRGYEISIYPDGNRILGPRFIIRFYRLQRHKAPLTQLRNTLTTYEFKKS